MDNKKQKKQKEEIIIEYELYLKQKFKYPKSQLCYLYFKGDCLNKSCQFAHGVKELRLDDFFRLINDKETYRKENRDQWQKPYFYKVQNERLFGSLVEYQNNNKYLFQRFYTQEDLIANPRKRMEIRKILNKQILTEVINLLLSRMTLVEINKLYKLIEQIGFPFSIKQNLQQGLFFTKVIKINKSERQNQNSKANTIKGSDSGDSNTNGNDKTIEDNDQLKKTPKKGYYCILYLSNEAMIKRFIEIIDQYYNENIKNENCLSELFPCSFNSISRIINKRLETLDPSPSHYVLKNTITHLEFTELLCNILIKTSSIPDIRTKRIEDMIYQPKVEETISEIIENFWAKHFAVHSTQFAFVNYHKYIYESFVNNKKYIKDLDKQSENDMKEIILLKLHQMDNLFFFDNTGEICIFNYKSFGSYDIEELTDSYYHKRCGLIDKQINDASITLLDKNNEEPGQELSFSNGNKENEENKEKEISIKLNSISFDNDSLQYVFIDSHDSLLSFLSRIKQGIKEIAVDIEGQFKVANPSINLIQLALNENEVFVIDICTFLTSKDEKIANSVPLLKAILTAIFESESIIKIFFDGRRDVSVLHLVFNICPISYVDLSSIYSASKAFQEQIQFKAPSSPKEASKKFDKLVKCTFNHTMKGINTILYLYQKDNKVNQLKEKMHHYFDEKPYAYFTSRPINREFVIYSALDVKYLVEVFDNMRIEMKNILKPIYGDIKHINLVLLLISNGHLVNGCNYANSKIANSPIEEIKTD